MSVQPGTLQFSLAALAGLWCFWLGLAIVLVRKTRRSAVSGALLALGGLLACYALAGVYPGKAAAAFYFACLSVLLLTAQLAYWTLGKDDSAGG